MNASGASGGVFAILLSLSICGPADAMPGSGQPRPTGAALLRLAQAGTQPLESLQVGPPPVIVAPPAPEQPAVQPFGGPDKPSLQLRVDPATGKPLTAEDLKAREQAREQEGIAQPRMLTPRRLTRPQTGSGPVRGEGAVTATKPQVAKPSDIVVESLTGPDAGSIGVLEPEQGGFGHDMWAGTGRQLVLRLLPALPAGVRSPLLQSLQQRLLLSTAVSPAGEGDGAALLLARAQGLWRAGQVEQTRSLLRLLPQTVHTREVDMLRLDVLLATGATGEACALARNMLERAADTALQKTAAYCLAVEKKSSELDFYEQLLRSDGVEDPAFYDLLALLSGRRNQGEVELKAPTLLHLAMARTADTEPRVQLAGIDDPLVLRMLATQPKLAMAERLEAAERAAAIGALPVDDLRATYDAVPFTAEQRAETLARTEQAPGAMTSAALYQAARDAERPETRLALVEAAWRNAARAERRLLAAAAFLPHLRSIEPAPTLAPFAPLIVRVLLAGGEREKALAWFLGLIPAAQAGQADAAAAVAELTPLVYASDADGRVPARDEALRIWWQSLPADEPSQRRAALVVALLDALGRPAEAALADAAVTVPLTGNEAGLTAMADRRLANATLDQRIGEAVLLSLAAFDRQGAGSAAPALLVRVVAGLQEAGLADAAQSLAVEGLLERGF